MLPLGSTPDGLPNTQEHPTTFPLPAPPTCRPPEVVDPVWLVKALALAIAVAAVFGYLSICLLIYQGGWQRMLSPSPTVDRTPSIPFETVPFDSLQTGHPRLSAWWLPSTETPAPTILFLHDGSGSLSTSLPSLDLLHRANVNIFAIDYRGFGHSEPTHPNQIRMQEDAEAALNYLTQTRHLPAASVIPYGVGLGAVLATNLVNQHPELPALVADTPDPDAFNRVIHEDRSRLLPMRLLIRDHFDIAAALAACTKPKLLLADSPSAPDKTHTSANQNLFRTAPDPKFTVTFARANSNSDAGYIQALSRFLDQYVPQKGL